MYIKNYLKNIIMINLPFLKKGDQYPIMILFLYSNNSEMCRKILEALDSNVRTFFRFICVDNPKINKLIKESETVKISQIPTILLIYNGLIEEADVRELLHNINIFMNRQQKPQSQKSFTVIDPDAIDNKPLMSISKPQKQRTKQSMNEEYGNNGVSTNRIKIAKGVGHKGMGISTLNSSDYSKDDSYDEQLEDDLIDDRLKLGKASNLEEKKNLMAKTFQEQVREREELEQAEKDEEEKSFVPNSISIESEVNENDFNFDDYRK